MNQMTSNIVDFKSAEPASGHHVFHENAVSERPGLIARFVAWFRHYLAARRTLKALDQLSQEQLKDIGYRRIPDSFTKYEPLP